MARHLTQRRPRGGYILGNLSSKDEALVSCHTAFVERGSAHKEVLLWNCEQMQARSIRISFNTAQANRLWHTSTNCRDDVLI